MPDPLTLSASSTDPEVVDLHTRRDGAFEVAVLNQLVASDALARETAGAVLARAGTEHASALHLLLAHHGLTHAELYAAVMAQPRSAARAAALRVTQMDELPEAPVVLNDIRGRLKTAARDAAVIAVARGKDLKGENAGACYVMGVAGPAEQRARDLATRLIGAGWTVRALLTLADQSLADVVWSRWDDRLGAHRHHAAHSDSELQKMFDHIALEAYELGASDVHIVTKSGVGRIYYRLDGDVTEQPQYRLTDDEAMALVTCAYNTLADQSSVKQGFDRGALQDASIDRTYDAVHLRFRYAGMPVEPHGHRAALRIIPIRSERRVVPLADLGYAPSACTQIYRAFARASGLVLFLGTTGSGKSTTLANGLGHIIATRPAKAVLTVEEPVEYIIPGAHQTAVRRMQGEDGQNAFQQALREIMRADPDVLMLGEIRDLETADMALQGVRSGHLLLSTLHAASAPMAYDRMAGLGVPRADMATMGLVGAFVFQALVQTLCPHCRIPAREYLAATPGQPHHDVMQRLQRALNAGAVPGATGLDGIYFRSGDGCKHCGYRGITGRTVCAEVLQPTRDMLPLIARGDSAGLWEAWRSQISPDDPDDMTGRRAIEHATWKMAHGICAPDEVERQFRLLDEPVEA